MCGRKMLKIFAPELTELGKHSTMLRMICRLFGRKCRSVSGSPKTVKCQIYDTSSMEQCMKSGQQSSQTDLNGDTSPDRDRRSESPQAQQFPVKMAISRLALSFGGCGFLGIYHFGTVVCLQKHGQKLLQKCDRIAGTSAGALVAAMLVICPEKLPDCVRAWYTLAGEVSQQRLGALSFNYSLISRVENYLDCLLPTNAHELATDRLYVAVTKRVGQARNVISKFDSREKLIKYLLASCYIPYYTGPTRTPPIIDGQEYTDGWILVKFDDLPTVTISPFSGEADVCPDDAQTMFDWRFTVANQEMKLSMDNVKRGVQALFPSSVQSLEDYYALGYADTMKFLLKHCLFEREEGTPV